MINKNIAFVSKKMMRLILLLLGVSILSFLLLKYSPVDPVMAISAVKIADRISVFKDGKTIETAPSTSFIEGGESLKDEYSKRLWNSLPQNNFLEDR